MRVMAAIRTNTWGDEERRLLAALQPVFGVDIAVVFHDRPSDIVPPVRVVDLSNDWVLGHGLALVPDWGWRCGDYFYYALCDAYPDYDYYWMIEPDVHFTARPDSFFAAFTSNTCDALGYKLGPFGQDIRFTRGLAGSEHFRAIFALTRFSGAALHKLFRLRQQMNLQPISVRDYPNDEIFAFSHVAADENLHWGRLEDLAPTWFEDVQFDTDPDLLLEQVQAMDLPGRVLHPVRGISAYKRALSKRLASRTGILMRVRDGLDRLSDKDVDDIATAAGDHIRTAINTIRNRRLARTLRRGK